MRSFEELTGLYSLSKTLRFELKPIGRTLEHIENKGLIMQDERRAEEYKIVKDIIDRYHKNFISWCLSKLKLEYHSKEKKDSLEEYLCLASISKRTEAEEQDFELVKTNLRKQVAASFKNAEVFSEIFKKELIQKILPDFVTEAEERQMVENFNNFTSYFSGFHKNRANMYSDEEKSTAIAYRLIHENLPMFIDNMKSFEKIAESPIADYFTNIESSYSEYLNVLHLNEIFQLDYFTEVLTQQQIEVYNNLIGGRALEDGTKIQGINEYVNLYNQQQKDKKNKLPLLKPLYKMILSDRDAISWLPEEFKSDEEMIDGLNSVIDQLRDILTGGNEESLRNLLLHLEDYDLDHIFIANDLGLTDISQQLFGQYDVYTNAIKQTLKNQNPAKPKELRNPELYADRINRLFKSQKSFSITELNACDAESIQCYFAGLGAFDRNGEQKIDLFTRIELAQIAAKDILEGKHANLSQSEEDTKLIKDLMDAYKDLQRFIKPLLGNGDEADKDNIFDARLRAAWNALDIMTPLYNKVRNWMTRKPYSEEKIKLNFENAQLLGGWDVNKEPDCTSVLLRKDGYYYLAIMDKKSNRAFDIDELPCDGECYEKVDYKQMALPMGLGAFVRKCSGTAKALGWDCPSNLQTSDGKIIIKDNEANGLLPELIDCYKSFLNIYEKDGFKYKDFNFKFKSSKDYEKLSQFFAEVPCQGYKCSFRKVSVGYINHLVEAGKLYLFQIWNKDFSAHSKGTPNMHTLYWKMLFDDQNLSDVVYKLNGQAEVFYRKRSLDLAKTTVHRANQPIVNKNKQNAKTTSTFEYDIIKNRRYTVDKFQFHVPITINFKATGNDNINAQVLDLIRQGGIKHIIGIDRGERHLLYLSLIDLKGNIVKQMTLNDIVNEYKGNTYATNYKDLLTTREGDRTDARRNWKKLENIKDLKAGYLSQVVHIIAKMMVKYQAIVVLEDLNMGFMRGRQKIERNVYEQFEKMLIDKLNYYVDKQKEANEPGGLLHALQLANKFESFRKLGKQSGCLFYIPAWNTSKIDPVTGFVKLKELDTRYENADKARLFFSKFSSICYNEAKDWFEFSFDYNNFGTKAEGSQRCWTLCSHGTRIMTFRNPEKVNQWDNKEVVLTDEFKKIFREANIDINGNLLSSICSLTDKKYLEPLMHLMKLLLQMRNSITNSEVDYLISPVADENGNFYDSRTCGDNLPKDADANGAYNIARKGLWAVRKIQETAGADRVNLAITNREWLQFAQLKPYLNE